MYLSFPVRENRIPVVHWSQPLRPMGVWNQQRQKLKFLSWWIIDHGSGHCTGRVTSKIQFLNWNCPLT